MSSLILALGSTISCSGGKPTYSDSEQKEPTLPVCRDGQQYNETQEAVANVCRVELEYTNQKPYIVQKNINSEAINSSEVIYSFSVEENKLCLTNGQPSVFNSFWTDQNQKAAESCAESLTRLSGGNKAYTAQVMSDNLPCVWDDYIVTSSTF